MSQIKVSTRLALGFGLVLFSLAAIVGVSINSLSTLSGATAVLATDAYPKVLMAQRLRDNLNVNARSLRNMLLVDGAAEIKVEQDRVLGISEDTNKTVAQLEAAVKSESGQRAFNRVTDATGPYRQAVGQVVTAVEAGNQQYAASLLYTAVREPQQVLFAAIDALVAHQSESVDAAYRAAEQTYRNASITMTALGIMAVLLGATAALIITRTLTRQLGGEPSY